MGHPRRFASSSRASPWSPIRWPAPAEAEVVTVDQIDKTSSTTSTIATTVQHLSSSAAPSSSCTSPSPTRQTPSRALSKFHEHIPSALDIFRPKTFPRTPTSKTKQFSSPVDDIKQHLHLKASRIKLKVRRKPSKDRTCTQDLKVPPANLQESSEQDPPETPSCVLPACGHAPTQTLPRSSTLSPSDYRPLYRSVRSKQEECQLEKGYLHKSISKDHTFVKMASESAQPPVTYSRLQQITTSACEKALGSITSYNHASTEEWNTTIINTILGTLVEETTPHGGNAQADASTDAQSQPPFKYVVNSTIIQHAPVSLGSTADPAVTGRRGMHAASGAFWSNEKDGMWSYKYSAAENKGFDVVVGIIWIWVG